MEYDHGIDYKLFGRQIKLDGDLNNWHLVVVNVGILILKMQNGNNFSMRRRVENKKYRKKKKKLQVHVNFMIKRSIIYITRKQILANVEVFTLKSCEDQSLFFNPIIYKSKKKKRERNGTAII